MCSHSVLFVLCAIGEKLRWLLYLFPLISPSDCLERALQRGRKSITFEDQTAVQGKGGGFSKPNNSARKKGEKPFHPFF